MTILYWDCFSGIAGNMAVASLLDLGASRSKLVDGLKSMHFSEGPIGLIIEERLVDGIRGLYFNTIDDEHEHVHEQEYEDKHAHPHPHGHDHDDEHPHQHDPDGDPHDHPHDPGEFHDHAEQHGDHRHHNDHEHAHEHAHDHSHCHDGSNALNHDNHQKHSHDHGHAPHRGLTEICSMINNATISAGAKQNAINCFRALAEAEATIHGKSIDEVHFHEVGARDSIADIVGVAICLDDLQVSEVRVSPVHLGSGLIKCAHGIMPVPAPATALLLKGYSVVFDHDVSFELTTPTGAAILKGMNAQHFSGAQTFTRVGHGHGSRKIGRANFLRAFLTDSETQKKKSDQVTLFSTNIDNATGEELGHAIKELMDAGALDACLVPLLMKKGRPGQQLQVLASVDSSAAIEALIFNLLPTIGIRRSVVDRTVLEREPGVIESEFGQLAAKQVTDQNGEKRLEPEFDELVRVAKEQRTTPQKIKQRIVV